MIRKLLLLIIFIVFPILTFGQSIWTNPITGTRPSNSNPYTTGDVKNPNISVSGIRRGSALNASNGDNRYNAIGWNNSSLNPNSYFEFTLTPNSGYQINFNSFVYNGEAGGTGSGPAQFQVRSSLDGFTSAIGSAVTGSNTISLSNSNYQNISSSISFRIYAYGASNSNRTYSINDFTFNGEVCTVAITTGVSICQGGSGSLTATSNGNTTNAFSGSWNAETDPTALRPRASINNTTTCGFDNVSRNYTSTIFTVTTTGVYTFKMTDTNNYDGMAYIYEGNFTPGTCSGGGTWIIGDDDNSGMQAEPRMITTLTAGKIYTLISTTYGSTGTYSGNYTWNVTQPQGGQLVLSPVYWYTSSGTLIGAGSPFNPVGVTGSGLNNTNSIGTTTYYASIGGASCTRTPTNFVINGDSPTTSLGTYNFCIDNNNTQTTGNATAGQYALVNVIKGYTYTFSVGNIFTSNNEKLNILNAATDLEVTPTASNTTATGAQISNWTATFSGQIKVVVSTGSCTNIGIAGTGGITLNLTGGSNTFETQNEFGTNTWVGHIYNAGGATPEPFSANYAGYYNVPTETINENFGGDANCFPVYSNGTQRASIYTEGFAVRYKMKTTRSGCYIISITGDDGVRLFLNGTKILDRWIEQGSTTYSNVLVRFDGDDDLVFEYYENAGANIAGFSMAPFDGNVNTITAPATVTFCSNGNPDIINGSLQYSSTSTTLQNPQLNFQWQLATDAGGYANIPGATDRTYDPPAIANNTAVDIVRRFRRQVTLNTANIPDINGVRTNCTYTLNSNVVTMTTVPTVATPTVGTITNINCTTSTGSVALSGLPSGSWTIERTPDLVTVNGSGATTTLTGLAAGTYTFNVTNNTAGCKSAATANVVISDQSATTWNGTAWSNGPPTATKNVTFAGSFPITADLNACSCTINSGIGINVPSGRTLNITNAVIVSGTGSLVFENNSSLVQGLATTINANSGNITYKRNTTAMRLYDYTYWSSPVSDFSLYSLSPNTVPNEYYSYNPTLGWSSINNGAANMTAGVGYILSAPRSFSNTYSTVYNANFIGTPNNGDVNVTPIATKWNLVGNPYPSSLDARQFIIANTVPGAETIEGSLYFWTHNTLPDNIDPGQNNRYFYTSDDYAAYNLTGSLVTSKSATTEATAGTNAPSGNIASGQGFFVKALTNNPIQFKNNMRLGAINTQFFKTSKETEVKDRVWLNLTNTQGAFKQILVGYIEEATNGVDVRYDATSFNANAYIDFYSVNGAKKLSIQGRALPFEKSDVVPLGYKSTIAGEFTIAIDHAEGIFSGQQHVYLEDKLKDIIYDLSTGDYTFTTEIGTFTNRFEIRYASKTTLGTGDYDTAANTVLVSVKNKELKVTSTIENIKEVTVYDISGKLLYDKKKVNSTELQIQNLPVANQVVLVKITLENNSTQTKKVIVQ